MANRRFIGESQGVDAGAARPPLPVPARRTGGQSVSPMRRWLFELYWALERKITPGAESSQNVYARIVKSCVDPSTRWLDLGCGHQLWPDWIPVDDIRHRPALIVGLDPDAASLEANAVIHHRVVGLELPFRSGAFNLVTANMVFEHLQDPISVLADIRRVLAPGGTCVFHTPNARYWQMAIGRYLPQVFKDLLVRLSEGRHSADVYPTFYRINTERAARAVSEAAGFQVDQVLMVNTSSTGRIVLLGPLVVVELAWLRLTRHPRLSGHRVDIIGTLRTPGERPRDTRGITSNYSAGAAVSTGEAIDPVLLDILACPACHATVHGVPDAAVLQCDACHAVYEIHDRIPHMMARPARRA
jgi:uncharacterized protein YbaR (Trm112 family)/SAM-dependent methyltransferase